MNCSALSPNMASSLQQLFVAFTVSLLVAGSNAQNGLAALSAPAERIRSEDNPATNNSTGLETTPVQPSRPKQNITLNDLLTALLNIQKNQLSTTENPPVTTERIPAVTDAVTIAESLTTPTTDITDILNGRGVSNMSVIILNIGDLLGNKELQILNGLNGINCQQGYIYVILPEGQGQFIPLNQANVLPQNGVPSYIILLANQLSLLNNPNWQQVNGILSNLHINIPGLSKIGSIPIYAPTNSFKSSLGNTNLPSTGTRYPGNNPNLSTNPNYVPNGGVGLPIFPNNPNINFVEVPVQPTGRPNINIPGMNLPTPAPEPTYPGIGYPNVNIITQPAQPPRPSLVPNVNFPNVAVNLPNQPNVPVSNGVNIPINWAPQPPVNPSVTTSGMNIIWSTQPGISVNPNLIGNNIGVQYPTGMNPRPPTSNANINITKLLELLGLKITNVPSKINAEIGTNVVVQPNLGPRQNIPQPELVNLLLQHLASSGLDGSHSNNNNVKITIEKGLDKSLSTGPQRTDILMDYLKKNANVLLNGHIGSGMIPSPTFKAPVIQFEVPKINIGSSGYNPNLLVNIPSNGVATGQVAVDPQYLATLLKTFSGISLPNGYIPSGFGRGTQPGVTQNVGTGARASINSVLWNYLLAHLGCIPDDQLIGGTYIPHAGNIAFTNYNAVSNWAQTPQLENLRMAYRRKRAVHRNV